MVRFFVAGAARVRRNAGALLVRGMALLALVSLLAGAARLCVAQAQPAFFSLLFPQLTDWAVMPWDAPAQDEAPRKEPAPGEAVAL